MIVDDGLNYDFEKDSIVKNIGTYLEFLSNKHFYKLESFINERNNNIYPTNISQRVNSSHEVHLSKFPLLDKSVFIYKNDKKYLSRLNEIVNKDSDIEKIIAGIKSINPDYLFIDLEFACNPKDQYLKNLVKTFSNFESRQEEFDEEHNKALYNTEREKLRMLSRYNKKFNYLLKNQDKLLLEFAQSKGGVILSKVLQKEKIPFSFWTSDYGHAENSLLFAEMNELVTSEDISSAMDETIKRLAPLIRDIPVFSNERGNILMNGKNNILYPEYDSDSTIDLAVNCVRNYQS